MSMLDEAQASRNYQALIRPNIPIVSPLRYPGSKRRLAGYIEHALGLNGLRPELFVEPFAGGASVSLQLLANDKVERIGLIDRDPLVASFWQTVFFDADWLVEQVAAIQVTLEQWHSFKKAVPDTRRERALACLFLNRTSFSGILAPSAGPIGGQRQASAYGIGCRFPRERLISRIRQAEALKDRVAFIWNDHWNTSLARVKSMQTRGSLPRNSFYYLDPPFFEKADKLYTYYFQAQDHRRLKKAVMGLSDPWILSYDPADGILKLYANATLGTARVELLYGDGGGGHRIAQEVIISNLSQIEPETRLWRNQSEWKQKTVPVIRSTTPTI